MPDTMDEIQKKMNDSKLSWQEISRLTKDLEQSVGTNLYINDFQKQMANLLILLVKHLEPLSGAYDFNIKSEMAEVNSLLGQLGSLIGQKGKL